MCVLLLQSNSKMCFLLRETIFAAQNILPARGEAPPKSSLGLGLRRPLDRHVMNRQGAEAPALKFRRWKRKKQAPRGAKADGPPRTIRRFTAIR